MLWLKITLLIGVLALAAFCIRRQERKRSAIRSSIQELDLHQCRGLNDLAVTAFSNRLGHGQTNVAALLEIIAATRNRIAALEGKAPERAVAKTLLADTARIYKTTSEEAAILQGLQSYMYNEHVSPQETGDLQQRLANMESAFENPAAP